MTAIDDDEKMGIALTSQARASLMAKLARNDVPLPPALSSSTQKSTTQASRNVQLKNMFDPSEYVAPEHVS
jgi:hypothetical protein